MGFQPGNKEAAKGNHRKPRIITQQIIASLNEAADEGVTKLRKVVDKLIGLAMAGDVAAIREVLDRVEGKPPQFSASDANEFRRATDMSDDELANIASGSGGEAAEPESNSPVVH